jgi:preprotein translocase subunit SecG
MEALVLVIHLLLALALIVVVLLQRSEGGALGIGGGGGGLMTGRGAANFLTRTTAVLAAMFIATSLVLAVLAGGHRQQRSILDQPAAPAPAAPAEPAAPQVPVSK